jgi:hypothetical protein
MSSELLRIQQTLFENFRNLDTLTAINRDVVNQVNLLFEASDPELLPREYSAIDLLSKLYLEFDSFDNYFESKEWVGCAASVREMVI